MSRQQVITANIPQGIQEVYATYVIDTNYPENGYWILYKHGQFFNPVCVVSEEDMMSIARQAMKLHEKKHQEKQS